MTQEQLVWVLFSLVQIGLVGFVGYWTKRVTKIEDAMVNLIELRERFSVEYQGRMTTMEVQYKEIVKSLTRIENILERHLERDDRDSRRDMEEN